MTDAPRGGEAVRIASVAAGGDGVGRLADGRVVFVPRTAPGDLVVVSAARRKGSYGRAPALRIEEPSPLRAQPSCAHWDGDRCGGCALQHLRYDAQVAAKAGIVRDALERIARAAVPPFEIVPNPRPLGWRTRLALSVDPRTGAAGLRRAGRADEVFPLVRCEIATPAVRRLWDALRAHVGALPPGCERITLREDRAGALHVVAHGAAGDGSRGADPRGARGSGSGWRRAAEVAAALDAAGAAATLWVAPDGATPRAVAGVAPSDAASALAFEQVDPAMGDLVRAHAVSLLGDVRGLHVWDLYAGIGETTAALAAAGATVESVEADATAVAAGRRAAAGPAGAAASVARHTGRVEDVLGRLRDAAVAIVNPPRAGLGAAVTDALAARPLRRLVYVSCDPATLARDVARLAPRLRLTALRAFDSFPQTAHVETVAMLDAS